MEERDILLEEDFGGLTATNYRITSNKSPSYNCIAWAVGDTRNVWDDVHINGYYWPKGAGSADTLNGWKRLFVIHGYTVAEGLGLETDYERVAIYVDEDEAPTHVARQKGSGKWTSKLGQGHDIEHLPEGLEGAVYGKIGLVMKRKCQNGRRVLE